jgi:hypothetical protein
MSQGAIAKEKAAGDWPRGLCDSGKDPAYLPPRTFFSSSNTTLMASLPMVGPCLS